MNRKNQGYLVNKGIMYFNMRGYILGKYFNFSLHLISYNKVSFLLKEG